MRVRIQAEMGVVVRVMQFEEHWDGIRMARMGHMYSCKGYGLGMELPCQNAP